MTKMNRNDLVDAYSAALEELGLSYDEIGHGEDSMVIKFTDGNGKFLLLIDKNDAGFVTVLFPNFYPIESEEEFVNCVMAATKVTSEVKSAKVMVDIEDKQVSVATEFFDYSLEKKTQLLKRYISAVEGGVHQFLKEMRTEGGNG